MSDRDERAVADQAIQRVSRLGRRQRPAHDDVAERSARSWVPPVCGRRLVRDFGDQSVENRVVRALKGRETWNERYRCVQRRSLATGGSDLQHAFAAGSPQFDGGLCRDRERCQQLTHRGGIGRWIGDKAPHRRVINGRELYLGGGPGVSTAAYQDRGLGYVATSDLDEDSLARLVTTTFRVGAN